MKIRKFKFNRKNVFWGENRKIDFLPVKTGNSYPGYKKDLIFKLSGSNYIGLMLKIFDICLLYAKKRQFPVFKRSKSDIFGCRPEMRGRCKNLRSLSFLRILFFSKSYFNTFITRGDRYCCFLDYFRLHDTILNRPMTQFNSLAITSKKN